MWLAWLQVLTSKSCSEEGLDDATSLLLQLSWANNATRHAILGLLLEGARTLGLTVRQHIWSATLTFSSFSVVSNVVLISGLFVCISAGTVADWFALF